jgi:hypothetical protein
MPDGLAIRLAYSKTDQEAQGDTVGVPFAGAEDICTACGERWLQSEMFACHAVDRTAR